MRKMTWEATSPSRPRCEICKGGFGLIRYRIAHIVGKWVQFGKRPEQRPTRKELLMLIERIDSDRSFGQSFGMHEI